jgi:hypothetical protein
VVELPLFKAAATTSQAVDPTDLAQHIPKRQKSALSRYMPRTKFYRVIFFRQSLLVAFKSFYARAELITVTIISPAMRMIGPTVIRMRSCFIVTPWLSK